MKLSKYKVIWNGGYMFIFAASKWEAAFKFMKDRDCQITDVILAD